MIRIAPGESVELSWTINAILEGDYLAYITVIPEPGGEGETSSPVASPGIRFVVAAYAPLNPGGVLPVALRLPIGLFLLYGLQKFLRSGRQMQRVRAQSSPARYETVQSDGLILSPLTPLSAARTLPG